MNIMKLFVKTIVSNTETLMFTFVKAVDFGSSQVFAPTSALPTTQQSTPSPATTAGENGTTSRNAEVEVGQPDIPVVQKNGGPEMSRFIGKTSPPKENIICFSYIDKMGESYLK